MKPGGGKSKGSGFEREVCKKLSLWVTRGKKEDCFWRSAMSGGRATVAKRKDIHIRQAGDICSVSPEGHALTDLFFIECKFYKDLGFDSFILDGVGTLMSHWNKLNEQANKHNLEPMLIARQNRRIPIVVCRRNALCFPKICYAYLPDADIHYFDRMLECRFTKLIPQK